MSFNIYAQDCDCRSQFNFVKEYYEQNNPAFQKINSNEEEKSEYNKNVFIFENEAGKIKNIDSCIFILDRYVSLLKDHHSEISYNLSRTDLSSPALIEAYKNSKNYKEFERISIDTAQVISELKRKSIEDIEGIYSNGTSIVFGIMKKPETSNQYIGVVLKPNKLLEIGQVLMELRYLEGRNYDITYNTGLLGFNIQSIHKRQNIINGQIPSLGYSKLMTATSEKEFEFRSLNTETNYLRLSSFDKSIINELDSLYQAHEQEISTKPFLIIDIRNNAGGSEQAYFNLLKYAYTQPLRIDASLLWVSPQNIRHYEEQYPENTELLNRMKNAPLYSFIPQVENADNTWELDSSMTFPKKIVLLYNKSTASAAEGLIYYYAQSQKVITAGESSGGYVGYGNVMSYVTPCKQYSIRSTSTQYFEKSKYEYIGIPPMFVLDPTADWIEWSLQQFK